MKNNKQKYIIGALALLPLLTTGCKESWLDPKPLSFYTPENTYVDAEGMYSAIVACERNMRHEFFGDQSPILTEYYTSDVAVNGKTDESGALVDFDNYMLPTQTQNNAKNKMQWYWDEGFKGIKYANIVLSRIDAGTYKDEAERNAVLGTAYFQRAYRYYKLTHQFGNVPFLDREYTEPKLDFYSHDRWSILEQLKKDLEFAYEWVPEKVDRGRTSKAACGVLLMKVAMCLGDFDRAIEIGKEIVANHPLMTARFTSNKNKPNTNLMHDLHNASGSWRRMTDLYYNDPGLKGKSEWYGKHLVRPTNMSVSDSVRCWFSWPHYKLFVPDPTKDTDRSGGETAWYIYRSAEVYLLMGECYYWKDQLQEAANMLNVVRERAGAEPLNGSEINIGAILAERARELYYEECRHIELVRISYIYAKTGKPCEVFGGRVYKLDNFSGPGGTGSNVKEPGYNFWYDWMMTVNNFFRDGTEVANGKYRISVHHVLWPVPYNAITTNTGGVINQNIGYPGAENNITPLKVGEETPAGK